MLRRKNRDPFDVAFYVPWTGPLLAPEGPPTSGGAETQIFLLTRELARRGVKVAVIVFDVPGVRFHRRSAASRFPCDRRTVHTNGSASSARPSRSREQSPERMRA